MKKLVVLAAAALLMTGAPVVAVERAELESACAAMGMPAEPCKCIIDDTMTRFAEDPRMREVILLSFGDRNVFNDMEAEGKITPGEIKALDVYQAELEPICMKDE